MDRADVIAITVWILGLGFGILLAVVQSKWESNRQKEAAVNVFMNQATESISLRDMMYGFSGATSTICGSPNNHCSYCGSVTTTTDRCKSCGAPVS